MTENEPKKRPAFQFYPGDWRKDVELRSCTIAARGLWVDLMCVMHDCEPYGHLVLNGKPMNPAQISGQIGLPPTQVKKLLQELIDNGVARQTEAGLIYSKRMVDDEERRNRAAQIGRENGAKGAEFGAKGAEHGKKGGRPRKEKGGDEGGNKPPQNPPSSSSSSSSSSEENNPSPLPGFAEFWSAWPRSTRKGGKAECEKLWRSGRLESVKTSILAHVQAMAASQDWTKENGAYIPAPAVYLRQKRWDGADEGGQQQGGLDLPGAL